MSNAFYHRFVFAFVIVVLCSVSTGCHTASNDSANKKESAIDVYCSSIKSIKLPFIDTCYDTMVVQHSTLPDSLSSFKRYGQLIGLVNTTNKYVAILYAIPADVQLPVLCIFNKDGVETASLKLLLGDCCGENEACSGSSTVRITKDLHIILKDSTQTFERDKKNADKKYHVQIEKKEVEYIIDSTGKILPLT